MVVNKFYRCKVCGETIRLRYQVGYCKMPINLYCPKCNTHFSGEVSPNNDLSIVFSLNNAIECDEIESGGYVAELSPEFLTIKYQENKSRLLPGVTPFLRYSLSKMKDENFEKRVQRIIHLAVESKEYASQIETLFNLLNTNDVSLIRNYIDTLDNEYLLFYRKHSNVDNLSTKLDYVLFAKQYSKSLINSSLLPKTHDSIDGLFRCFNTIINRNDKNEYKRLLKYLDEKNYFGLLFKEIPVFVVNYIDSFKQFVPCYLEYDNLGHIDFEELGISSADACKMCEIYSNGFELMGRIIDPSIALDNLYSHMSFDNFGSGRTNFAEELAKYKSKFNKVEHFSEIDDSICCSFYRGLLNNRIRNPIAHYDWKIDGLTQSITFTDRIKGVDTTMYLAELVFKCIDVFNSVFFAWEVLYQLFKAKLTLIDKIGLNYSFK